MLFLKKGSCKISQQCWRLKFSTYNQLLKTIVQLYNSFPSFHCASNKFRVGQQKFKKFLHFGNLNVQSLIKLQKKTELLQQVLKFQFSKPHGKNFLISLHTHFETKITLSFSLAVKKIFGRNRLKRIEVEALRIRKWYQADSRVILQSYNSLRYRYYFSMIDDWCIQCCSSLYNNETKKLI